MFLFISETVSNIVCEAHDECEKYHQPLNLYKILLPKLQKGQHSYQDLTSEHSMCLQVDENNYSKQNKNTVLSFSAATANYNQFIISLTVSWAFVLAFSKVDLIFRPIFFQKEVEGSGV